MLHVSSRLFLLLALLLPSFAAAEESSTPSSPESPKVETKPSGTPAAVSKRVPEGMVEVPAGEFMMGSNESGDKKAIHKVCRNGLDESGDEKPIHELCRDGLDESGDEKPIHEVYLDAFMIDKTEVTVSAYRACVDAGHCSKPDAKKSCNWAESGRGEHPINCVDWNQSVSYCEWRGKRLPTEAEWEKAARGTKREKYPWGSGAANCSNAVMDDGGLGCGILSTWPVGSKPAGASPYGAQDMAGNVWEWTSDGYEESYYSSSPSRNPTGPSSGSTRVLRGGCWSNLGDTLRVSNRNSSTPSFRNSGIGFRCASPL